MKIANVKIVLAILVYVRKATNVLVLKNKQMSNRTKEEIANWKNNMKIKKLEQKLQNEKNKNRTITRSTWTPRCKRGEVLKNNRCVKTFRPWDYERSFGNRCIVETFTNHERRVCY